MTTPALPKSVDLTLWRWCVPIASLIAIAYGFWRFLLFMSTASDEGNPETWENWVFVGFLIAGCLYTFVAFVMVQDHNRPFIRFWKDLGKKLTLGPYVTWQLGLALFPLIAIILIESQPHRLYVPEGKIRVLSSGLVLAAGESVVSNRYKVTSTLVPLVQERPFTTWVNTPVGAVSITGSVRFTINPTSPDFASLARQHRTALGTKPDILRDTVVKEVFDPITTDLVRGVQSGMLSGSRASLVVQSGLLMHRRAVTVPWVTALTFGNLSVASWEQTFE